MVNGVRLLRLLTISLVAVVFILRVTTVARDPEGPTTPLPKVVTDAVEQAFDEIVRLP